MRNWVIALVLLVILVIAGGCSSTSSKSTVAFAQSADMYASHSRAASALSWGSPTVLESTPPHCTIGRSLTTIGGNPAVSYMIHNDQEPNPGFTVYYARANDAAGTSWGDPVAVDFWEDPYDYNNITSLREVNGKPAIAYQVFLYPGGPYTGGEVRFVRAKDPTGKNWGNPVAVGPRDNEGLDWQGNGTTLNVVNGNPVVWYTDFGYHKYVRALDGSGSSWGIPQIAGPAGTMSIVNGLLALRYRADGVLYFRRSADAGSDSWLDPVTIGLSDDKGSFEIVNGHPFIRYRDSGVLNFCCSTDANGDSWGAPVTVGLSDDDGSFEIVNAHPAVAYSDSGVLYFVRAADANGGTWGNPQTALADADPAGIKRLVDVDGCPAITFSGTATNAASSVRFIRAQDADGVTWPSAAVDVTASGDASVEWLRSVVFIDGLPSVFFYSGNNEAENSPPDPPAYSTKYLNFVQALDSSGSAWETPETVVDFGYNTTRAALTVSESCVGIAFSDVWHAMNFIASTGAAPPPPDPAVIVQLSTDKSAYIIGEDTEAVLTAVVTDEYGDPISGLAGSFVTTLDGGSVSPGFSEGSAGTYTGSISLDGLLAGDHTVQTTVTDSRGIEGSDSATFSMNEPGTGGTMHVSDLDASVDVGPHNWWRVSFTVKVDDSSGNPVDAADVSFSLSGDDIGDGQVTTGSDGTASYQTGWIKKSGSVAFTVTDVTHATLTYSPGDNDDPDGDSDGTSITATGP